MSPPVSLSQEGGGAGLATKALCGLSSLGTGWCDGGPGQGGVMGEWAVVYPTAPWTRIYKNVK